MGRPRSLTEGNIFSSLIRFAVPVLFTLFLQALYGGVDLLVVGQFAQTADVSGVATGSMLLQTVTMVVTGLSMGITILVGERIGRREPEDAGRAIGGGICLFACFAVLLTAVLVGGAEVLARLMHAPEHAFHQTVLYIRICGAGSLFIVAYNVLGSIFRGSATPGPSAHRCHRLRHQYLRGPAPGGRVPHGAAGAALATVAAQTVSVLVSLFLIRLRRRSLPFAFSRRHLRFHRDIIGAELRLGTPVALQELLVGTSFLLIQAIVNSFGVAASAGVGWRKSVRLHYAGPSAYMQSMSSFVAQNMGRATRSGRKGPEVWHPHLCGGRPGDGPAHLLPR